MNDHLYSIKIYHGYVVYILKIMKHRFTLYTVYLRLVAGATVNLASISYLIN